MAMAMTLVANTMASNGIMYAASRAMWLSASLQYLAGQYSCCGISWLANQYSNEGSWRRMKYG